jgi:N-acetylmuramoyl-L-alanine amidase
VADGQNNNVIKRSVRFGHDVRLAMRRHTRTTMPKVLIECGNMNNRTDGRMLSSTSGQRAIARALEAAIVRFLADH